jgi:hypothetical protein
MNKECIWKTLIKDPKSTSGKDMKGDCKKCTGLNEKCEKFVTLPYKLEKKI